LASSPAVASNNRKSANTPLLPAFQEESLPFGDDLWRPALNTIFEEGCLAAGTLFHGDV
jgi:hypothetical protein